MTQARRPAKKAAPVKKAAVKKATAKKAAAAPIPDPVVVVEETITVVAPVVERAKAATSTTGRKVSVGIAIFLVVLALLTVLKLGREEAGGPPHDYAYIGNGIPVTVYLPGEDVKKDDTFPEPAPVGERPALIVMAHGYSSDQQGLSTMARSLAKAGFATATFDFRGHGGNRNRFAGDLDDDLATVVDWAETYPYIDPSRIVILGHSMGAGAGLDFATLDKRINYVIPVSGGFTPNEVNTPEHVLFIRASGDPGRIHEAQDLAAKQLRARPNTEVEVATIGGTDHLSVVSDARTFDTISSFLDKAFGAEPTNRLSTGRNDPRRGTATFYALLVVILFGFLGRALGRAVKPLESTTTGAAWGLLALASFVVMPLSATGGFSILPVGAGQAVAVGSLLAAGLLWSARFYARAGTAPAWVTNAIGDGDWLPLRSVAVPGVIAGLAMFVLLAPAGVILHATVPNFERTIYWILIALALLPFFAAFEAIVRKGTWWQALLWGLLGRALLLVGMVVGLGIGALPGVLGLILPTLVIQYVVLEIFASAAWAAGRNTAVIAVAECVFLAWITVMFSPIG